MEIIIFALSIFFKLLSLSVGKQPSLLDPPWKHCVHRLEARKAWQGFASPNFPKGITTQTQCSWIISTVPPRRIKVSFKTLNLTGSVNNCFTQFVEIWEIRTASSMGKFCGDRRPGDFVSYGSRVRIDLKADTAAAVHAGFEMQYRFTKEVGGFKKTNSFWKKTPKKKSSKSKTGAGGKSKLPVGGRVNLARRKQIREKASKTKVVPQKVKPKKAPNRITSRTQRFPTKPPPIYNPNKELSVKLKNGNEEGGIKLWIIVLISVGGLLFLIVIGVISWLCFCHKRNPKNSSNQDQYPQQNKNSFYSTQNHLQLPGEGINYHESENQFELENGLNGNHYRINQIPVRRAPRNKTQLSFPKMSNPNNNIAKTKEVLNLEHQKNEKDAGDNFNSLSTKDQKLLKHLSSSLSDDSISFCSVDDEGYETSKVHKTKKLPVMKRELSEWEKNELNRIKRKL